MKFSLVPLFAAILPLGGVVYAQLPAPNAPTENPITEEKRILGKLLFFEEQLSSSNDVACATCHRSEAGGVDPREGRHPGFNGIFGDPDDVLGSEGVLSSDASNDFQLDPAFGYEEQATSRTAPSYLTAAYHDELFWDGRASSTFTVPDTGELAILSGGALESQCVNSIVSPVEMGHEGRTWAEITQKLELVRPLVLAKDLPGDMAGAIANGESYPDLFQAAFGDPGISAKRIAFALATYERSLVPNQTPWDLYQQGQTQALTPAQVNGLNFFMGQAQCDLCHEAPLFSDDEFHNLGNRPHFEDTGRRSVTGLFSDRGRFKTPSLRNVGLHSRFFHNGQNGDLNFGPTFGGGELGLTMRLYFFGGGEHDENLDADIDALNGPGGISQDDMIDVRDFVENGLTDPRVAARQFPFDRPTLYSERTDDGIEVFETGVAGAGGLIPEVILEAPPVVGNGEFRIGVRGALGGAPAFLSVTPVPPGGAIPFSPRARWTFPAITLSNPGGGAGAGHGTWHGPLRNHPGLIGRRLDLQWHVLDSSISGLFARSRTFRVTLF